MPHFLLACLTAVLAPAASAQSTAPAATPSAATTMASPQPASAESEGLGRLFFTPAERARLDELRRRPPPPPVEVARPVEPPPPPAPRYVTVNGVVRRSDGESIVWINNKPVRGNEAENGLTVSPTHGQPPGHVTVRVPQSGRSVEVKVGQQVELNSGVVQESYRDPPPPPLAAPSKPSSEETSSRTPRRPNREREFLRELLREIEAETAARAPRSATPAPGPSADNRR